MKILFISNKLWPPGKPPSRLLHPTSAKSNKLVGQTIAIGLKEKGYSDRRIVGTGIISGMLDQEKGKGKAYEIVEIIPFLGRMQVPMGQSSLSLNAIPFLRRPDHSIVPAATPGDTEECRSCGNNHCPFWNRLIHGDRTSYIAASVPDGKVNDVSYSDAPSACLSWKKGKPKPGNLMLLPGADVLSSLGVGGAHPLNGLSYSPVINGSDTFEYAKKRLPSSMQNADRGEFSRIESVWCPSCKKRRTCAILAYRTLDRDEKTALDVEAWIFWQGEPTCTQYVSAAKRNKAVAQKSEVAQLNLLDTQKTALGGLQ